jgi:hypothetical protein
MGIKKFQHRLTPPAGAASIRVPLPRDEDPVIQKKFLLAEADNTARHLTMSAHTSAHRYI